MKYRLIIPLQVGQSLDTKNTDKRTKYFSYFAVSGGNNDTIVINLNGVVMAFPGGFSMSLYIESLSVISINKSTTLDDSNLQIIAIGEESDIFMF